VNITSKVDSRENSEQVYNFYIKRSLDYLFATLLLILCIPLLIVISLLIKLDSPGPIFYKQQRVDLNKECFYIWKFRTMTIDAEVIQSQLELKNDLTGGVLFKLKNDPRVTRFGTFLRRSSLDELPQIINVLMGEMSIIGPRPLSIRDAQRVSDRIVSRYDILPGITGLWQVKGRNSLNSEEIFVWDDIYVTQWSLVLDFKIMLQTFLVVIKADGAY